jgi:hypothetical protein
MIIITYTDGDWMAEETIWGSLNLAVMRAKHVQALINCSAHIEVIL